MRQSVRIMKQCLEKLRLPEGGGPVAVRDNKIVPPLRAEMKRSMEATIGRKRVRFQKEFLAELPNRLAVTLP
jgi:NADH:ubiquinone oxidoreductase subunit D